MHFFKVFLFLVVCSTLGFGCDKKQVTSPPAAVPDAEQEFAEPFPIEEDLYKPGPVPGCRQIDCKTGRVVDDGCVEIEGERVCASCTNRCP